MPRVDTLPSTSPGGRNDGQGQILRNHPVVSPQAPVVPAPLESGPTALKGKWQVGQLGHAIGAGETIEQVSLLALDVGALGP
jgi:hypothetical protein